MKLSKTKLNSLVKVGKTKWLCFDWDKARYVMWDSKKQSMSLFKQRNLNETTCCITGCTLD